MTTVGTIEERAERETTRFFAIVAGIIALVLSAVVVFVVRHDGGGAAAPVDADPATRPLGEAELTAETVKWTNFFGTRVPSSSAGPRQTENGLARGFDRTNAGAVLAAIHIAYRAGSAPGPAIFQPTIRDQVLGADKDRFLATIEAEYVTEKAKYGTGDQGEIASPPQVTAGSWVAGYRLDAFSPQTATVQVLLRSLPPRATAPLLVNLALNVTWTNGDWRLVAPLNGQWANVSTSPATMPEGYVALGDPSGS